MRPNRINYNKAESPEMEATVQLTQEFKEVNKLRKKSQFKKARK
jgi:hypothetical protein